jgi:hypothetical protein
MTDAKVDPQALAERLEQWVRGLEAEVTIGDEQFLAEVVAALRQRPQEERRACFRCSEIAGVVNDPARHVTHGLHELCPQAPEERPDLIALERLRRYVAPDGGCRECSLEAAWSDAEKPALCDECQLITSVFLPALDRVLSALRAQPASKEK